MRSKEVDEAIHRLYNAQNNVWKATLYNKEQQEKDILKIIDYIWELEAENKNKEKSIERLLKNGYADKSNNYVAKDKVIEKINERMIKIMEKDGDLTCCDLNLMVEYNLLIDEILWGVRRKDCEK